MAKSPGQRVLGITFLLTLAFCILEFVGGKLSGSLALTADAAHMLTDLGALGLALFAAWMSGKSPSGRMTYGYYRVEILSALINGAALLTIAIFIVIEAVDRYHHPVPVVRLPLMLGIAFAGFFFNVISGIFLARASHENINVRGAFFHIISDTLSSVGTLIAGLIMMKTGRADADPIISFVIAALIVSSAIRLLKDVVEVLLEAAPSHINVEEVEKKILSIEGLLSIHDLHIWSITSGKEALSAHLHVRVNTDSEKLIGQVNEILSSNFGIAHTTLQIETGTKIDGPACSDCE